MTAKISEHNKTAASVWSQGGAAYNEVSAQLADALSHAVQRLRPQAGEEILEVATGTGWVARNLARNGAKVTAIDIAEELLNGGRTLSAHVEPPIDFQLADAEALPFSDGCFDKVISTFGVMFAGDQQQAADELARVCKSDGRLVLTTWDPEGTVGEFFWRGRQTQPRATSPGIAHGLGRACAGRGIIGRAF